MSMEYIRKFYKVPAKRGGRVRHKHQFIGTITGSREAHLRVRMDGSDRIALYHPTWEMEYLNQDAPAPAQEAT